MSDIISAKLRRAALAGVRVPRKGDGHVSPRKRRVSYERLDNRKLDSPRRK